MKSICFFYICFFCSGEGDAFEKLENLTGVDIGNREKKKKKN